MPPYTLAGEIRNATILAQRLYGQCRKSASGWRALTSALRRMRNVLEDLEDHTLDNVLTDRRIAHTLASIQSCVQALREVDRHLQFYRCSAARWQAAITEEVAAVDAKLNTATNALVIVLETESSEYERPLHDHATDTPDTTSSDYARQERVSCTSEEHRSLRNQERGVGSTTPVEPKAREEAAKEECGPPDIRDDASTEDSSRLLPALQLLRGNVEDVGQQPHDNIVWPTPPSGLMSDSISTRPGFFAVEDSCEDPSAPTQQVNFRREASNMEKKGELIHASDIPLPFSPVSDAGDSLANTADGDAIPQDEQKIFLSMPRSIALSQHVAVLDWRSPFADVDPLSIDFDSATTVLLGTPHSSKASSLCNPSADVTLTDDLVDQAVMFNVADNETVRKEADEITIYFETSEQALDPTPTQSPVVDGHHVEESPGDLRPESDDEDTTIDLTFVDCLSAQEDGVRHAPRSSSVTSKEAEPFPQPVANTEGVTKDIGQLANVCKPESDNIQPADICEPESDINQLVNVCGPESDINQPANVYGSKSGAQNTDSRASALPDVDSDTLLLTPTSRFAAFKQWTESTEHQLDNIEKLPGRSDSKVNLLLSAIPSPHVSPSSAGLGHDLPEEHGDLGSKDTSISQRDHSTPVSPISLSVVYDGAARSSSETDLASKRVRNHRARTLSEPPPALDIVSALKHVLAPPPLPPKGRYRIVNPSPLSRRQSMESVISTPGSRSVSPISVEGAGQVPVIQIEEPATTIRDEPRDIINLSATATSTLDATAIGHCSTEIVSPSSADSTAPANTAEQRLSRRYYRQDFTLNRGSNLVISTNTQVNPINPDGGRKPLDFISGGVTEYYGSSDSKIQSPDIDLAGIDSICQSWYIQEWTKADNHLLYLLETGPVHGNTQALRRIKHLLGVSASFQGQWHRAIGYFISAINAPLFDAAQIDEGDCAALIWLADCYVLSNRRLEAFIANSLVVQSLAVRNEQPALSNILLAEQRAILSGGSIAQLEAKWTRLTEEQILMAKDTIVDPEVASPRLIELCFDHGCGASPVLPLPNTTLTLNRASKLQELDRYGTELPDNLDFKISRESFRPSARWPMPFDPFFSVEQAARGRLCDRPGDLLAVMQNAESHAIPKNGPFGPSRLDCFTCGDAEWLVIAVRDCLTFLEMRWDEVANVQGMWFLARFAVKHRSVQTANYFAISLFKQSMRPGIGVEICVDGVRSARIMNDSVAYPMGVHYSCEKRLKKFFRDYLTRAHRLWVKNSKPADGNAKKERRRSRLGLVAV